MACTVKLFEQSRHKNGKISANVSAGTVYSGLQSMADQGDVGAAAAANAVGVCLDFGFFLAGRGRREGGDGEKGRDECNLQMDE